MDPSLLPVRTLTQEFSIVEDQLHIVRLLYEQQHLSTKNTYTTLKERYYLLKWVRWQLAGSIDTRMLRIDAAVPA